ncbi:ArnT family glycosyltransferase [Arenicellales bacterium IMCC57338]
MITETQTHKCTYTQFFEIIFLCVVAIVAITIPIYFAILDPDWHHDGIMFKPASDLAAGLALYKDSFFQYGALTAYLHAFALKIFGHYLIVIRLEAALFLSLIALLMFVITNRSTSKIVAGLTVIIWISLAPYMGETLLPWSSIYALFFVTLSSFFLCIAIDHTVTSNKAYWVSFAAGISISCAFWARQPVGLIFPIAFLIFAVFLLDKKFVLKRLATSAAFYCLGFIVVAILMTLALFISGSLKDWWIQSIVGASGFMAEVSNAEKSFFGNIIDHLFPVEPRFNRIKGMGGGYIWSLLPILNLITFLVVATQLLIKRSLSLACKNLLIVSIFAVGMWHQYFPVSGAWQIYWGASLMVVSISIGIYLVLTTMFSSKKFATFGLILILGLIFVPESSRRVQSGLEATLLHRLTIPTLEGMWATPRFASRNRFTGDSAEYEQELLRLENALRQVKELDPNRPLVTLTSDHYLAATLAPNNPGPMTAGWYLVSRLYPDHQTQLKKFIKEKQPIIELYASPRVPFRYINWLSEDPEHIKIREEFGLADYGVLLETEYGDAGTTLLLAPKSLLRDLQN